jgi:hypothetical protein
VCLVDPHSNRDPAGRVIDQDKPDEQRAGAELGGGVGVGREPLRDGHALADLLRDRDLRDQPVLRADQRWRVLYGQSGRGQAFVVSEVNGTWSAGGIYTYKSQHWQAFVVTQS